ncbi:MAG TPA: lipopolysaccharide kinase InaA family protein, partial [Planctomycetaceae bacterium]|nr:lipopolysaccharide kinase InaA family protein [Planctomycetaceae bacterium]
MDRAATRHQSEIRLVAADGAAPRAVKVGDVAWRGDERIVRELYDHGFASLCRSHSRTNQGGADPPASGSVAVDRVTVVKSGSHRSVFRIELASGAVFVKHFKAARWWDALRNAILGTQAERESRAAGQVAAAGIETIHCVAVGVQSQGLLARDSYLASRAIANVTPLDELARSPQHAALRTPAFRRELARSLGRLCGRLHRAGLVHRDLHPANLLAEMTAGGRIALKLIDLQGVRRRRRWGFVFRRAARARWDLFGLFNFFQNAIRSDRCRFLTAYLDEAGQAHAGSSWTRGISHASADSDRSRAVLARQIEAFCRKALRREQLRYDKKWQRSNRRLIVADLGRDRCRGLAVLGIDQVLELRANPDALFRPERVRFWLRRSACERAAVVDLWAGGAALRSEVQEKTRALGWLDLLPSLRCSSMRRAWEMAHALRRRGVSTPRVLLYLGTRTVSRSREILVSERSGRYVPLTTFLAHQFSGLSARQKEAWIKANARVLANELARMREFSLIHRQISAADVLVSVDANEASVQIGGTDRIERKRFVSRRRLAAMLGQLEASLPACPGLSRTQRLRFLKKYLGADFTSQWKSVWRAIASNPPRTAGVAPLKPSGEFVRWRAERAAAMLFAVVFAFSGCQAVERPVTLPVKYEVKCERDQLLVLSNFKLQKDHELIRELSKLREQEAK